MRAKEAKFRREHPDIVKARMARYYAAHPERVKARTKSYAARNRDKRRAMAAKWRAENPEKFQVYEATRRAREIGTTSTPRAAYIAFVKWAREARTLRCYWCKERTARGKRHLDHIVPLSKGGVDSVANLCVACPHCNLTKSSKLPEDFSGQSELRLA